jgi:hypothetical protein
VLGHPAAQPAGALAARDALGRRASAVGLP